MASTASHALASPAGIDVPPPLPIMRMAWAVCSGWAFGATGTVQVALESKATTPTRSWGARALTARTADSLASSCLVLGEPGDGLVHRAGAVEDDHQHAGAQDA